MRRTIGFSRPFVWKSLTGAFVLTMMLTAGPAVSAQTQVRITGHLAHDFAARPSVGDTVHSFSDSDGLAFWGPGWEVIMEGVSLGGTYMSSFFKDESSRWWLDWYGEPLYIGYHVLGARAFLDPFVHLGVGSAGRVSLEEEPPEDRNPLYISIFPFVAGGLALRPDGFLFGARFAYYPLVTPPPGTDYENYPLGKFQVAVFAGVTLGRGPRRDHRGR